MSYPIPKHKCTPLCEEDAHAFPIMSDSPLDAKRKWSKYFEFVRQREEADVTPQVLEQFWTAENLPPDFYLRAELDANFKGYLIWLREKK